MDVQLLSRSRSRHEEYVPALVRIPAGWFLMGCDTGQDNEKPVHRVWVDEFLLTTHQVTNADYARFLGDTASQPPPFWSDPAFNHPAQPVVGVSWHEAVRYCEWLSAPVWGRAPSPVQAKRSLADACSNDNPGFAPGASAARKFRLPTEAEWERAARGGNENAGALFPWGDAPPQSLPGYADRCAGHWKTGPEPVGQAEPTAYGLFNVCDNVHEWCSDWYAPDYYAVSPERNPRGPETGARRASRGGSWRHHIKMSRCAARSSIPPEFKYADYGFRVACDVQLQVRG
jgi:formylglycine-generating enzyme required for sulfatase activity